MPVFISHAHADREFVDKLAMNMVNAHVHVWVDRWELHVGDSLISRIQEAIQEASALIVVLSRHSVQSAWCRIELNAGLIRELEEKRVVLLPVVLDDCEIPLFLHEKLYADFRTNYDDGFRQVLESVARVTSNTLGRVEALEWHVDWGLDWGEVGGRSWIRMTLVEQAQNMACSVLTEVTLLCNEVATARYMQFERAGLESFGRQVLLESISQAGEFKESTILLTDSLPRTHTMVLADPRTGIRLDVTIACRRLGEDTGRDILLHVGSQVVGIIDRIRRSERPLTQKEIRKLGKIRARPFPSAGEQE